MPALSRITILPLAVTQYFVCSKNTTAPSIKCLNVVDIHRDTNPSTIAILDEKHMVLKLIKPRKWIERIKYIWLRSRVSKEIRSNSVLQNIGIRVPRVYSRAYAINPAGRYLGYLLMEDLEFSGNKNAQEALEEKDTDVQLRRYIIENMIHDVRLMQKNNIVFTDLKLNNIYTNATGQLTWIDTGVNIYSRLAKGRFISKNNYSIKRFLRFHKSLLTTDEAELVATLLL